MESHTIRKLAFLKRCSGQVALDDFGAGYNSEVSLLAVKPDFYQGGYVHCAELPPG